LHGFSNKSVSEGNKYQKTKRNKHFDNSFFAKPKERKEKIFKEFLGIDFRSRY